MFVGQSRYDGTDTVNHMFEYRNVNEAGTSVGVMGQLLIDRAYNVRGAGEDDGAAYFLVDRLWPRGVKKEDLPLDGWPKELTPSAKLRKELHAEALTWRQFTGRYREELDGRLASGELDHALAEIRDKLAVGDVVLLFAGKDTERTHARVLREWLDEAD